MGRSLCVSGHPAAAAHVGGKQQLIEVVMTASSADGERQRAQRAAMGIANSVLSVVVASALGSGANWGRLKRGGAFFFSEHVWSLRRAAWVLRRDGEVGCTRLTRLPVDERRQARRERGT